MSACFVDFHDYKLNCWQDITAKIMTGSKHCDPGSKWELFGSEVQTGGEYFEQDCKKQ